MTYPLLPYSQLVLEVMGEAPGVYDTPVLLRISASEVDVARLEAAVRAAIRNHPVLSMRLDAEGHHPGELEDELHGQYHSVSITEEGEYVMLSATFNRILGDMTSIIVLADDISRAYRGLELELDRYMDYLKSYWESRRSSRMADQELWLADRFDSIGCPVRPHTDHPSDLSPQGTPTFGLLAGSIPVCEDILRKERVTPTGFVSLCVALAIMDYDGTDAAALTWAYAGRDTLDEQRVFGSLHRDIPLVIRRADVPSELFRQARVQLRSGIAHSGFPYTLTPPHTEVWNYAVNVLDQPDIQDVLSSFPFTVEILQDDAPQPAYSLLDIELTDAADGTIGLLYKYSSAHYRLGSIERFASLVRANALWLLGGHCRATHGLEALLDSDEELSGLVRRSVALAAVRCPDRRLCPVQSLDDLYVFLDRFLVSRPWESLGLGEEMSLFRRIDQSTGYFLYLFDQPLEELEGRGYLYPSVQYVPEMAAWIRDFNNAWRKFLDSPDSWDADCLALVASDPLFGLSLGWYEAPERWHCWNDFFSRRLSGPAARPLAPAPVIAPADGLLQESWAIDCDSRLSVPDGACLKTASVRSVAELLGDSPFRSCFAGGLFVHQMLDFYDYHRFHCPVDGIVRDIRTIGGISGSGGVVVWSSERCRYEYANPGEPGFQMLETRGVLVIDAGPLGLVALVAVGMAQVCSVNWAPGLQPGREVRKGDELGFFLCGGSDVVLLCQKNANLQLLPAPGLHLLTGEGLMKY